jgi:hypothetical protein
MAFRCLLILPLCIVGRNDRQDVNTLGAACKLLKRLGEAEKIVDAAIMAGQGTIGESC